MRNSIKGNEQGATLILVVLIVMTLTMIGAALLINISLENRIACNQQRDMVLQYLAEAGIDCLRAELVHNGGLVNHDNDQEAEDARRTLNINSDFGEVEITAILCGPNSQGYLEVYSTARLADRYQKTILAEIRPPLDFVLLAGNELEISWIEKEGLVEPGCMSINGNVLYTSFCTNGLDQVQFSRITPGFAKPVVDFESLKQQVQADIEQPLEKQRWCYYNVGENGWVTLSNEDFLVEPLIFVEGNARIYGDINYSNTVVATGVLEVTCNKDQEIPSEALEDPDHPCWHRKFNNCKWLAKEGIYFIPDSPAIYFKGLMYSPNGIALNLSWEHPEGEDWLEYRKTEMYGTIAAENIVFKEVSGIISINSFSQIRRGLPPGVGFENYGTTIVSFCEIFKP